MFFKFILIFLVISIQKSSSEFMKYENSEKIPEITTTENLEELVGVLDALKNVTVRELCSVPCNDENDVPQFICDFCKIVPEIAKEIPINIICQFFAASDQCKNLPPEIPNSQKEFCQLCLILISSDLEPGMVPPSSSSSESLLNGSEKKIDEFLMQSKKIGSKEQIDGLLMPSKKISSLGEY